MVQDEYKWKNQDFADTVYHMQGTGPHGKRGFLVEAVHIERPHERAYRYYEDLAGLRGADLFDYLDEQLELYADQP